MEILYLWLLKSENNVFKETGFNLSPEHNFYVKVNKKKDKFKIIDDPNWKNKINVFHEGVVQNLTAIVGKNGSGKTELLDAFLADKCENCIFIVKNDNEISVYYSFDNIYKVHIETSYSKHEFSTKNTLSIRKLLDNEKLSKSCLKYINIYGITNSSFVRNPKWKNPTLFDSPISEIGAPFGYDIYDVDVQSNDYYYMNWLVLCEKVFAKTSIEFIANCFYLIDTIKDGEARYSFSVPKRIMISNLFYDTLNTWFYKYDLFSQSPDFETYYEDRDFNDKENDIYQALYELDFLHDDIFLKIKEERRKVEKSSFSKQLKFDLFIACVVEIYLLEYEKIENDMNIEPSIFNNSEALLQWISDQELSDEEIEYYSSIVMKIDELIDIISRSAVNKIGDEVFIGSDKYAELITFFVDCFKQKYTFFFRYLKLSFSALSSGEMAFNRIISWPYFQYQIDMLNENNYKSKDVLLLIDECDLYLHPEWQVDFISNLLAEIEYAFKNTKVQIILATHSPLCLSDIPRENTVYLFKDKESNKVLADDRLKHRQTFGCDPYSLLNDAFYINNSMGKYAKSFINDVIQDVNNLNNTYDCYIGHSDNLSERIDMIGNKVIHNNLTQKLKNSSSSRLESLLAQREWLDKEIARIENQNDQN